MIYLFMLNLRSQNCIKVVSMEWHKITPRLQYGSAHNNKYT